MRFVVTKSSNDMYQFTIVAPGGHMVAVSEMYMHKSSVLDSIATVRQGAGNASIEDRCTE